MRETEGGYNILIQKEIGYKNYQACSDRGRAVCGGLVVAVGVSVVCYCACLPLLLVLAAAQPLSLRSALS